ncbi:MAG: hypothetical protein ACTSQJ_04375 [Promethearchaeota archaeon]
MNSIFNDFNSLIEKIKIFISKNDLQSLKFNLKIFANIIFTDLKKNNSIVLYLNKNKQKQYLGFSTSAGFSLFGTTNVWRNILKGKKSILATFVEGDLKIPNLRVNWSNIIILSFIISSLNN